VTVVPKGHQFQPTATARNGPMSTTA